MPKDEKEKLDQDLPRDCQTQKIVAEETEQVLPENFSHDPLEEWKD